MCHRNKNCLPTSNAEVPYGHLSVLIQAKALKALLMNVCSSCGNRKPEGTVFCLRCGKHPFEAELTTRKLNWELVIAFGVLFLILAFRGGLL